MGCGTTDDTGTGVCYGRYELQAAAVSSVRRLHPLDGTPDAALRRLGPHDSATQASVSDEHPLEGSAHSSLGPAAALAVTPFQRPVPGTYRLLHAIPTTSFDGNLTDQYPMYLLPNETFRGVTERSMATMVELMVSGDLAWVLIPPYGYRL